MKTITRNYKKKIETRDSISLVEKFIKTLPVQEQLIIQLRDIEQYEFKEIAEVLEMKETAIRVALSRARKTLKEKLIKAHNYGVTAN